MREDKPWESRWIDAKPLGGGGQGDTFLVKYVTGTPDQAVLKLLRSSKAAKARRRMYREVANLRTLSNAGAKVPKVLDGNTEQFENPELVLFFVMEYVPGRTLAEVVRASGGLQLETAVNTCFTICETLNIAFREGIYHRDIKPENLIVRDQDEADVVMLDFGLSFNKDEESTLTEIDETLDNKFISLPERRGPYENKRDPRSDITSVCALLYYCLTAVAPRNLRDSQARPPHRWNEALLREKVKNTAQLSFLNSCLDKGLSYEIADRFQTVAELEVRLSEILKPPSFPPDEDLSTIAQREGEALFAVDARTRLAEYKKRASEVTKKLDDYIQAAFSKLNLTPFLLLKQDLIQRVHEQQKSPDVFNYSATLRVKEHEVHRIIKYRITVEENECVVYRQIIQHKPDNIVETVEGPIIVHRYLATQSPNSEYIIKDLIGAVKESMIGLREQIEKGE
jgi:eukaryotic-like serine/threonine-protein kinase